MPKIVIVILNWNGRDDTLECLRSLGALVYPNYEIIVVDNGSSDGSDEAVRRQFPDAVLIETGRNLGFAEGNNVGIREALKRNADFIFLLNNDTVVAADVLDAFRDAAKRFEDAGVFSGKIYYWSDPKRIWYAGGRWLSQQGRLEHIGLGTLDDNGAYETIGETDHACGCAMFLRASAIRKVGLLEPRFFLTFEETDWCFRGRKSGFSCIFVPNAKIWHKVSASFGGASSSLFQYFYTRNRLLWAERHLSFVEQARVWKQTLLDLFPVWDSRGCSNNKMKNTYWKLRAWQRTLLREWRDASHRAMRRAVADYILRRFGDCPASIRERNRRALTL